MNRHLGPGARLPSGVRSLFGMPAITANAASAATPKDARMKMVGHSALGWMAGLTSTDLATGERPPVTTS